MLSADKIQPSKHPLAEYVHRLESGEALLKDSPENVLEVVGILKSYGIVLDAYSRNLIYISKNQFLVFFPFFKYFNGDVNFQKLFRHWWHDRINFEYAEYCMKAMFWHGGGGLDSYVDTPEFKQLAEAAIQAKFKNNIFILGLHKLFPEFLPEQVRMMSYYSALGQFWRVMSDMFMSLSDRYDRGEIKTIPQVVQHILDGLVADASKPITYAVKIKGKTYDILPKSAGLTFLMDTAVPYVEAVFFRGTPFPGTISYNAQAYQIPLYQSDFTYGALYADPLPIGGAGIPPTQLMQDMRHFIPEYLHAVFRKSKRNEDDLRVQICQTFQKSMFCVTTAAIKGLAPYPLETTDLEQQQANRQYLETWMNRLITSRVENVNG
ncbi:MAG TPA: CO2 hydration protein [Oscillatoriales cyanobacterium M59_W2019_021]|nr:MAG: CO2 hydration protein [Cyanobacteria bacterium J055]HIK30937.1 CO2 hydration protein [Oscillatoriales cyanobacterium M4454_W2019_049]HIK52226.1 CO2 hydration protein [Oscillatoriales cyanobacterium M59_W2019_021]